MISIQPWQLYIAVLKNQFNVTIYFIQYIFIHQETKFLTRSNFTRKNSIEEYKKNYCLIIHFQEDQMKNM